MEELVTALIGYLVAYLYLNYKNKGKTIPKADYENLNTKFIGIESALKLTEEHLRQKQEEQKAQLTKTEDLQNAVSNAKAQIASMEAVLAKEAERVFELKSQLAEQTTKQSTLQAEINSANERIADLSASKRALTEQIVTNSETQKQLNTDIEKQRSENAQLLGENAKLKAENVSLADKLATQKEEIQELHKTSQLHFEKIAGQILEEKSGKFTEANKTNIEALLKPLGENIENFKKKVEETYDKESKQRFSLEEKVKDLIEQTNKVSTEANNLASALKGQVKKQGNWGEIILESILEQSGLVKDREYFTQATIKDDEGKSLRPDVLVKLPDSRVVIIDSKMSLIAYERFSSAEKAEEQTQYLQEHLASIYAHIEGLHNKQYDNLEASLDFTMMFIPIEPAYLLAIQADNSLWANAYAKRILLISPTNLIACLKLINDLWKREMQSKNAQEIVNRGEKMYEKFVGFANTMQDIGKNIGKTQEAYNTAMNQLNTGAGNLVGQAMKLKGLGLKSSKEMPNNLLFKDTETNEGTIEKS